MPTSKNGSAWDASTELTGKARAVTDLVEQLRGWQENDGMSDDARRKVWMMRTAASEIEHLRKELQSAWTEIQVLREAQDAPREAGEPFDVEAMLKRGELPF